MITSNRPKEDRQNVDIIFIANAVKQTGKSDEEVSHLKWFDLDKLPSKEEIAFDHGDNFGAIKKYLKKDFPSDFGIKIKLSLDKLGQIFLKTKFDKNLYP